MAKWWLTLMEVVVRALASAWAAERRKHVGEPPSTAEALSKIE